MMSDYIKCVSDSSGSLLQLPILEEVRYAVEEAMSDISNGNLCLRKAAVLDVGLYDQRCQISEDLDMCASLLNSSWQTVFSDEMVVLHRPRKTVRDLIRQYWGHGICVPYVFQKFNKGQWQILQVRRDLSDDATFDLPVQKLLHLENMPGTVRIFVSSFLLFHVLIAAAAVLILAKLPMFASIVAAISLLFLFDHVKCYFRNGVTFDALSAAGLRYFLDCVYFLSHTAMILPTRTLYVPNTELAGRRT